MGSVGGHAMLRGLYYPIYYDPICFTVDYSTLVKLS